MKPEDKFEALVRDHALLEPFLNEIAQRAEEQVSDAPSGRRYAFPAVVLFGVAAYALFRLVKIGLDRIQAESDNGLARRQAEIVARLAGQGFQPGEAAAVVAELLKGIRDRSADDPVLKAAMSLFDNMLSQ